MTTPQPTQLTVGAGDDARPVDLAVEQHGGEASAFGIFLMRGGDQERVDQTISSLVSPARDEELLAINEALDQLAEEDPESADLVKLRFFAGFTLEEIAESRGVNIRTVSRQWKYVRAWLKDYLES